MAHNITWVIPTWAVCIFLTVNMATARVVNRGETFDNSSVKNKWRWEWSEKSVKIRSSPDEFEQVGQHIRKINVAGSARCVLCSADSVYTKRGCVALNEHLLTKKHRERCAALQNNTGLPDKVITYGF